MVFNGPPAQTTPGPGQGRGGRIPTKVATLPMRTRDEAGVCLSASKVESSTRTGQPMVNGDTCLASRRGGHSWGGRSAIQHGMPTGHLRGGGVIGTAEGGVGVPPTAPTQQGFVRAIVVMSPSTEEGADLQGFTPAKSHLLLREVYGNFPHQKDGTHLARGFPYNIMWKSCWRRLAAQSASWYSTHPGKVGRWFTTVLAEKWRRVLNQKYNSKRPLVFAHVVLTKTLGAHKNRYIQSRINHQLDL